MDLEVFDEMVDELLDGDHLIADFDSGITIDVSMDSMAIIHSDGEEIVEIIMDGEEIDYMHLFLEALFVARKKIENINWNDLLSGN